MVQRSAVASSSVIGYVANKDSKLNAKARTMSRVQTFKAEAKTKGSGLNAKSKVEVDIRAHRHSLKSNIAYHSHTNMPTLFTIKKLTKVNMKV